jgi:hypothetical protein
MMEKTFSGGMVSWEVYDALHERYFDCLRKLRFFVKAGSGLKEEGTALEIIAEFLKQQESELQELRQNALADRDRARSFQLKVSPWSQESKAGPEAIRQEDRAVFGKLREICTQGGDEWENLKAFIDSAYAVLKNRQI